MEDNLFIQPTIQNEEMLQVNPLNKTYNSVEEWMENAWPLAQNTLNRLLNGVEIEKNQKDLAFQILKIKQAQEKESPQETEDSRAIDTILSLPNSDTYKREE